MDKNVMLMFDFSGVIVCTLSQPLTMLEYTMSNRNRMEFGLMIYIFLFTSKTSVYRENDMGIYNT